LGIGATVFFTGIFAFISSSYALYTVFDNWFTAMLFGVFWGIVIFNLDRYIVLSMKKKGSWFRDFLVAFPRLILAILLSLVISKPLELKIFEKEINAEIIQMEQEVMKSQEDLVRNRYTQQVADYQKDIQLLKEEIQQKTIIRDSLELLAIQEADGTGGSKRKNLGPIYKTKKKAADNAQKELDALLALYLPQIEEKEANIKNIQQGIKEEIADLNRSAYGGFAARMDALSRLGQKSNTILLASIFITLLFVAIETAPIFVKLIASKSPYDYLLQEHEQQFEMAVLKSTSLLENKTKNQIKLDTEVETYRNNAQIQLERSLIDQQMRERLRRAQEKNFDWAS
jgi:hypothetical protein